MNTKPKSKLLRPKADALSAVEQWVLCHDRRVIEDVREGLAAGLVPVTFSLIGDAVVLRLERKPLL